MNMPLQNDNIRSKSNVMFHLELITYNENSSFSYASKLPHTASCIIPKIVSYGAHANSSSQSLPQNKKISYYTGQVIAFDANIVFTGGTTFHRIFRHFFIFCHCFTSAAFSAWNKMSLFSNKMSHNTRQKIICNSIKIIIYRVSQKNAPKI